ncbi:MAG: hypothetical protein J5647_12915 [Spirochaetaceae bacterium]|nr:hypothetical protein [Spirochaetaceae bacterium]
MKKNLFICLVFVSFFVCHLSAQEPQSLYEIGFGKISRTHKTYMEKWAYTVSATKAAGPHAGMGFTKSYLVMHRCFTVTYVENSYREMISDLNLYAKTDLHPLSAYIGRPKEEFLADFPLGDNDKDTYNVTFFKSDKTGRIEVAVNYIDGIVDGVSIFNGKYMQLLAEYYESIENSAGTDY